MPVERHRAVVHSPARPILALLALVIALTLAIPSGASAALQPPQVSARSVYVYDMTSGIELYAKDPNERLQVGSIVKVATALVVMENAELDEQVKIQKSDLVDVNVYSNMTLVEGDTLLVSQLLYGLLIPSGNDGARALARHVGAKLSGSDNPDAATDAFVKRMNSYAAELGLQNTRFTVPDGIDTPNSYSTAHDVAVLGAELMKDDFLASVVKEPGYSFISVGPEQRHYQKGTTNELLSVPEIVGVKTGTTEQAGANVVLARQVNGGSNVVIMAIIGADPAKNEHTGLDARWSDADAIMAAMDQAFTWTTPDSAELLPGLGEQMSVWDVQFQSPPSVPVPSGAGVALGYQLQVGPEVAPGERAGAVHLYYDDREVGTIPIFQAGEQASLMRQAA